MVKFYDILIIAGITIAAVFASGVVCARALFQDSHYREKCAKACQEIEMEYSNSGAGGIITDPFCECIKGKGDYHREQIW